MLKRMVKTVKYAVRYLYLSPGRKHQYFISNLRECDAREIYFGFYVNILKNGGMHA